LTNLFRSFGSKGKFPDGKDVLAAIVDGTRSEDITSDNGLKMLDELHVHAGRKDLFGGRDH
jgi:hypothetical protein